MNILPRTWDKISIRSIRTLIQFLFSFFLFFFVCSLQLHQNANIFHVFGLTSLQSNPRQSSTVHRFHFIFRMCATPLIFTLSLSLPFMAQHRVHLLTGCYQFPVLRWKILFVTSAKTKLKRRASLLRQGRWGLRYQTGGQLASCSSTFACMHFAHFPLFRRSFSACLTVKSQLEVEFTSSWICLLGPSGAPQRLPHCRTGGQADWLPPG